MKKHSFKVGDLVRYNAQAFRGFPMPNCIGIVTDVRSIGCYVLFVEKQTENFVTFRMLERIIEQT
jgi:hypothetical protein